MEANSILRAAVGMRKTSRNSKNNKNNKNSSASAKKNTIRNIHKKIPEEDVSDRKENRNKNKVKRKHLQKYPKGTSDISEVKRDAA